MKAPQLFACVLLLAAIFALTSAQNQSRPSSDEDEGPTQCRRSVQRSCTSSTKSCGRLGKANICQAFQNDCQRQLANCGNSKQSTKFFRKVNFSLCKGLAFDTLLPCGSGGRASNNGTTKIVKF